MLIQRISGMFQLVCSAGGSPIEWQKEFPKGMVKIKSSAPSVQNCFMQQLLNSYEERDRACLWQRASYECTWGMDKVEAKPKLNFHI